MTRKAVCFSFEINSVEFHGDTDVKKEFGYISIVIDSNSIYINSNSK